MIEVNGEVTHTEAGFAWISRAGETCSNCDPKTGCKSIALSRLFCSKKPIFRVQDPLGVKVGEQVSIGIEEKNLLQSALVGYAMPVLVLVLGAIIGLYIGGECLSIMGGISGFFAAMIWLKRKKISPSNIPTIVRRVLSDDTVENNA
jgi:sigma-E factor negative regulatory protein RseC